MSKASDPEYREVVLELAKKWKAATDAVEASNPYGVRLPSWVLRPDWKLASPSRREEHRKDLRMGFAD